MLQAIGTIAFIVLAFGAQACTGGAVR